MTIVSSRALELFFLFLFLKCVQYGNLVEPDVPNPANLAADLDEPLIEVKENVVLLDGSQEIVSLETVQNGDILNGYTEKPEEIKNESLEGKNNKVLEEKIRFLEEKLRLLEEKSDTGLEENNDSVLEKQSKIVLQENSDTVLNVENETVKSESLDIIAEKSTIAIEEMSLAEQNIQEINGDPNLLLKSIYRIFNATCLETVCTDYIPTGIKCVKLNRIFNSNGYLGKIHGPDTPDNHALAQKSFFDTIQKFQDFITSEGLRHCCDQRTGRGKKIAFIIPYRVELMK